MTFNIFLGGAWDGEAESNTLLFELKRNWTGLLIELVEFLNLVSPIVKKDQTG